MIEITTAESSTPRMSVTKGESDEIMSVAFDDISLTKFKGRVGIFIF